MASELMKDRYLDREMSWLSFNRRVLDLAESEELPLLERVRFLSIFTSNLDEFFMVRVAGLKRRIAAGIATRSVTGKLPRHLHQEVISKSRELSLAQSVFLHSSLLPELASEGIRIIRWPDVSPDDKDRLSLWFKQRVFPVLTPLAVDPSHPFPYISGLSLNLAISVKNPLTKQVLFARVKIPPMLERLVKASLTQNDFVPLEDIIAAHLEMLFPGMEILQHHTFRVTRNEDVAVEEDDAENLLAALERELLRRRFGPPVRLEVEETMDHEILELLIEELEVNHEEVFHLPWPLDLRGLDSIYSVNRDDLKFTPFVPRTSKSLDVVESASEVDIFEAMRHSEILLHHPYDSFSTSVQRFLEQAAQDPHVLAIKQTLYRTSGDSPIVKALIEAAEWGKQVLAVVEIKARFDEEANIEWARKLEEAGVHVVYGLVGLKTHSKLSMVIREEGDDLRRYVHIGTGNYNPKTARNYEDIGLLTTNPEIASDVATLFNVLSGYAVGASYQNLMVAPDGVRTGLVELIKDEIRNHEAGLPSGIQMKCNAIVDETVIDALYEASNAGVPVELFVRGICALMPGVPGLSENIKVISILGRFLEHSRIYRFVNGGNPITLMGSADIMHRNLDRRVEALVKLQDQKHCHYIEKLLQVALSEDVNHWNLHADGSWEFVRGKAERVALRDYQERLMLQHTGIDVLL
jgi:polyphosphate kinase